MLAKMGWSEGQKLGKDNRGLSEPVSKSQMFAKAINLAN